MKKTATLSQLGRLCLGEIANLTSYKSILIVNDESSQPERLILYLRTLDKYERSQLIAVYDHEGSISFLWDQTPPRFRNSQEVEIPDGDIWSIFKNYELSYDNVITEAPFLS